MSDDISMSPLEFVAFICKLTRMEVDKAQKEGRLPHDIFAFEEGRTENEREEKAQKVLEKKKIAELESRVCKLEGAVNHLKILSLVDGLSMQCLQDEVSAAHDRLDWVHIP